MALPPLKCVTCPKKQYHHVAQSSAHLNPPPPQASPTTDRSFIEKTLIFWGPHILAKVLKWPWSRQKLTYVKSDHKMSYEMCQAVLSPNLTKIFQWEVSQIANNRFPCPMLLGGLSVKLNHLKTSFPVEAITKISVKLLLSKFNQKMIWISRIDK